MKKYLLLSIGVCLFLLSSCGKDKDNFVPYPLDGTISNLINEILDETSYFAVAPNQAQQISIDKMISLHVEPTAFLVQEENDITVSWLGTDSAIDMELLELPNYSNGKYLNPIHTFKLEADQNNMEVSINMEAPLELIIEAAFETEADLFFLSNEGWSLIGDQALEYTQWVDTNGIEKSGYKVDVAHKGWYSIAKKVDLTSETFSSFCIELSGEYTQGNTKSFVILADNIVVPLTRVMESGTFCSSVNIPIDQSMKVVVLSSLRKDNYEIYVSEQTMENGLIIAPAMEEKSIDEIKSILEDI